MCMYLGIKTVAVLLLSCSLTCASLLQVTNSATTTCNRDVAREMLLCLQLEIFYNTCIGRCPIPRYNVYVQISCNRFVSEHC